MKDAFENNFKQSLDNFEMPYDNAAWEAMQSRLDASASTPSFEDKMKDGLNANEYPYNPAAWTALSNRLDQSKKGGFKKWYVAAGIVGTAAVASLFIWNATSDKNETVDPVTNKQTSKTEIQVETKAPSTKSSLQTNNETPSNEANSSNENNNELASVTTADPFVTVVPSNNQSQNNNGSQATNDPQDGQQANNTNTVVDPIVLEPNGSFGTGAADKERGFKMPMFPNNVCLGEQMQIKNGNDYPIVVVYPNGLNWVGNENQVTRLNPSLPGTYKLGYLKDGNFNEEASFTVMDTPVADFDYIDQSQKYLDGLPTIELRSTAKGADYTWEYQNGTTRGEEVGLHFYEKGLHPVRLTVTNENGCSTTIEKSVSIDEDYNLIAMKAFNPNSVSQKNLEFMPYALKERDADFTMIIIDPNDSHVMFETSNAFEGWDGIDQKTGTMAPRQTTYIWQVTIKNPMPGEKKAYNGVVTLL